MRNVPGKPSRPAYLKQLGQHHLRSGSLCQPLLDYLQPADRDVIEIGPGGGVLTAELAAAGARVLALELDVAWACHLRRRRLPGVTVLALDATGLPWARLARPFLVTGNLPFNVGTRLIDDYLAAAAARPEILPRAAFMVQKEVGERLVARPATSEYGALSVLAQARAQVDWLGTVAPGSFVPPPKVSAAFVGFRPRALPFPANESGAFRRLVHAAFGQRRKTLRNSLGSGLGRERAEAALAAAGIDPGLRAEALDLATFVRLLRAERALG